MAIAFSCPCGASLTAPDPSAGTRGKCPRCGAAVDVPPDPAADIPDFKPAPLPERPRPRKAEPPPAAGPDPARRGGIDGGDVLAALLILVAVLGVWLGIASF